MGCLITDPPQFKPPAHTRPWLDASQAIPDPQKVLKIDGKIGGTAPAQIEFSAPVISQDDTGDGAFRQVEAHLYVDLGFNSEFAPLRPFAQHQEGNTLPSGSLDQTDRKAKATWFLYGQDVAPGCHRVTLMVSHIFDQTPCPVCEDDFSAITWHVLRCDTSNDDCGALPVTGPGSCEGLTNSCSAVRSAQIESGDDVPLCPSGTADGGAP